MKISARNSLKGKVKSIAVGAVNTEVVVELENGVEVALDHHERFCRTAGTGGRQRGLRRRQGERCNDRERIIFTI